MNVVQTAPSSQWPTVTTTNGSYPAPNRRGGNETRAGFKPRMVTGALQAMLGFILIVCGIAVVSVRVPNNYGNFSYTRSVRLVDGNDKVGWGIWIGASVFIASVFGILSKKSQAKISLYMAFSIVVSVMAFAGIWAVVISLSSTVRLKNALKSSYNYGNPCYRYKNRYNGNPYFGYPNSSSDDNSYGYGYRYYDCTKEITDSLKMHIAIYSIMLACLLGAFIISIIGAAFTCTGLDCCSSQPRPTQAVTYQTQFLGSHPNTTPVTSYTVQSVYPQQPPPAYSQAWVTGATPQAGNQAQWSNPQYKGYTGNQSSPPPAHESGYQEPMPQPNQGRPNNGYDASGDHPQYEANDEHYITVTE